MKMYLLYYLQTILSLLCYCQALRRTTSPISNEFPEYLNHTKSNRHLTATSPDDHKVTNLPGLDPTIKLTHYAGHLPIDNTGESYLFYWLFEASDVVDASKAPLIVWLNGGPGCSSMDGLFLELGPLRLYGEHRDKIKLNPDSWHNAANMLFIDQPVGTGLAYTTNKNAYGTIKHS